MQFAISFAEPFRHLVMDQISLLVLGMVSFFCLMLAVCLCIPEGFFCTFFYSVLASSEIIDLNWFLVVPGAPLWFPSVI